MRQSFAESREFTSWSDEELLSLAHSVGNFPDVLWGLYWEICERRPNGWGSALDLIEEKFATSRRIQLEAEMVQLRGRRKAVQPQPQPPTPKTQAMAPKSHVVDALEAIKKVQVQQREIEEILRKRQAIELPTEGHSSGDGGAETWQQLSDSVRHASVRSEIDSADFSSDDWAKQSPLAILGYRVGLGGLSDLHRQQFLYDFVARAVLPKTLPEDYLRHWGSPGTRERLMRTAAHIAFQKTLRESQREVSKFSRAIECWSLDLRFLERAFPGKLSQADWREIRRRS